MRIARVEAGSAETSARGFPRRGMMHDAQPPKPEQVTDAFVAAIAEAADVDTRSVVRRLAGLPVRGRGGRRIDAAIADCAKRIPEAPVEQERP
jgi:hypothetical protein